MAVTLNLGSKVIYSGESTTLTATVAGKTLTKAVFSYWVDGITSSKVSVNMTRSGATATIDLKTVFNAYNLDEIEFVYQVEVAYLSKNGEKVTSGTTTTTTKETQTDFSNQQSVIFRSTTNKALKVKETTNLEHPLFATRNNGFVNNALKNANAKTFTDNFEQATARVDSANQILPLVDVNHPLASKMRIKTPKGIKAVAQKTANFKNRGGATSKFYGEVDKATTTSSSYVSGYSKDTYVTGNTKYSYQTGSTANYAPKYYYYTYSYTYYYGVYNATYTYSRPMNGGYTGNDRYYYYYHYYYNTNSYQKYGYHSVPNMANKPAYTYAYSYKKQGTYYSHTNRYYSSSGYYYYYYYYYSGVFYYFPYSIPGGGTGYGSRPKMNMSNPARQYYSSGLIYTTNYYYYSQSAMGYSASYVYIKSYYWDTHTAGYGYYTYRVGPSQTSSSYRYTITYSYTESTTGYYYYNQQSGSGGYRSAQNGYYITGYTKVYGYKYYNNYGYYYYALYLYKYSTTTSKYYYIK